MCAANWTDGPCFYVSVVDAGHTGLVLGPFQHEADCRVWAYGDPADGGNREKHYRLVKEADDRTQGRAWFYSWGMVKMATGYKQGVLNNFINGWEA